MEAGDPAAVGDVPVGRLRQPETGALCRDADVGEQRALERHAHRPSVQGDDHRDGKLEDAAAAVADALGELEGCEVQLGSLDRVHVSARRERRPVAAPDDDPQIVAGADLVEGLEQLAVHLVIEGVVSFRPRIGERGYRSFDVEADPAAHGVLLSECGPTMAGQYHEMSCGQRSVVVDVLVAMHQEARTVNRVTIVSSGCHAGLHAGPVGIHDAIGPEPIGRA
jgi:hypothetical protein